MAETLTASYPELRSMLRMHDEAIYNWIGSLRFDYGNFLGVERNNFPLLRVFASPDRATALMAETLVTMGWVPQADKEKFLAEVGKIQVLPLPVATIERRDVSVDLARSGSPAKIRKSYFDPTTQQWVQYPWPGTYLIEYAVTFWCLKRYSELYFREWIQGQLGTIGQSENEMLLPVEHEQPWGTQLHGMKLQSIVDLSDLEGDQPRFIRVEASFLLNGLHFRKPVSSVPAFVRPSLSVVMLGNNVGTDSDPDSGFVINDTSERSANFFSFFLPDARIATEWPKAGAATVSRGVKSPFLGKPQESLRVKVTAASDEVGLVHQFLSLDGVPSTIDGPTVAISDLSVQTVVGLSGRTLELTDAAGNSVSLTFSGAVTSASNIQVKSTVDAQAAEIALAVRLAFQAGAPPTDFSLRGTADGHHAYLTYGVVPIIGGLLNQSVDAQNATVLPSGTAVVQGNILVSPFAGASTGRGRSLLSIHLNYSATAPVELVLSQRDPTGALPWETVRTWTLPTKPKGWGTVHVFVPFTRQEVSLTVRGMGVAADAHLAGIDVRQLFVTPTKTPSKSCRVGRAGAAQLTMNLIQPTNFPASGPPFAPTVQPILGQAATRYIWENVRDDENYVLCGLRGVGGSTDFVSVSDDALTPLLGWDATSPVGQVGFAVVMRPRPQSQTGHAPTLSVIVPDTVPLAALYLYRYAFGYAGNDVAA